MKTVLITGGAGFIGSNLSSKLLEKGYQVIGFDNMNDYYDVHLKEDRIEKFQNNDLYHFVKADLADKQAVIDVFKKYQPDTVVNLGAQAGVRYSITNPDAYIQSNIVGFFNILEACRYSYEWYEGGVKHLLFASSSSIYGANKKVPYSTTDKTDQPVSLYAATKKSNELLAYSYSKLYGIPATGLRFFTVYGPMGRPDMAYFSFTNKMVNGETIKVFNNGDMYRDFTYIDDIIKGIENIIEKAPNKDENDVQFKVYNIGNNKPETLMYFINTLEECLMNENIITEPAKKEYLPMQPGDVYQTYADVDDLIKDFGFKPNTSLKEGLTKFAKWYKEYYKK